MLTVAAMAQPFRIVKPQTDAEKNTETTLDCIEVSPNDIKAWKLPPFQRELKRNDKVIELGAKIKKDGGVIPGVLTLGILNKERYLVDGQHRREAFLLSECMIGFCDVRVLHFGNMADMGDEYVNVNQSLVKMRPDDILRGLEESYEPLAKIRRRCSFVGFEYIRRNESSPLLSMSQAIRCWTGSLNEVPKSGGGSAAQLARSFTMEDADQLIAFLHCAFNAWGRDAVNARLWSSLNITLCMWLYRRTVITQWSARTPKLTSEMFTKCMMAVSAAEIYVDWLAGRNLGSHHLAPAYGRLKGLFTGRLEMEIGKKATLPQPPWATSSSGRARKTV